MDNGTIGILGTVIGCFIALAGWLSTRDKKISNDSEWKGGINAKLDILLGIKSDVDCLSNTVSKHGEKIVEIEQSAKSAHNRIDEIVRK